MTKDDHPLLARLLRKVGASPAEAPSVETWRQLLGLIGRTYQEADQDRYTLERSIDISSREMQGLYQDLKRRTEGELEAQRAVLRATLESASEGILVVDTQRRVIAANVQFARIFGVPEELMRSGDHANLVAHTRNQFVDPDAAMARIEEIHGTHDTFRDEVALLDGRTIDRYSAPVRLPDGRGAGRVTFFRDVTANKTANAALEGAREAAEAASQAKSMFLANMSHELRTPLNAVIGLADLLLLARPDPVSPRQQEYLEGIVQSGRHLLALVNDVLDLAKIEAGKHELDRIRLAVHDTLTEAASALAPLARHRGIDLVVDVPAGLPDLDADPLRLRQILYNLISNAVKFTDRGGKVTLGARVEDGMIAIGVADTGIGIAAKDLSRLYRSFEQLEQPSGTRPTGTGLGLALSRRLIDMHGGSIEVVSEVGVGTTFTVRIPII